MPAVSFTDRSHGDTNTVHLIDINFEYNGEAKVSQYFEHKIKNSPEGMTNYVNGKFFIGKATELSDSNIHIIQRKETENGIELEIKDSGKTIK